MVRTTLFLAAVASVFTACKKSESLSEPVSQAAREPYFYHDAEPFRCTLEGSFLKHFPTKSGEQVPGEFDEFPATMSYVSADSQLTTLEGRARVRGQASLTVCTFPKLEFKTKDHTSSKTSPFYHDNAIKIGTHCGEGDSISSYGKLIGEKAVYREAFVYSLMSQLNVPGLKARRALIRYVDLPPRKLIGEKKAFVLESPEAMGKRLNWTHLKSKDDTWPKTFFQRLDRRQLALIHMFNVLVGNSDYAIYGREQLITQNIMFFEAPGGALMPVSYDFDLAVMVTGKVLGRGPSVDQPATYVDPTPVSSLADIKKRLDKLKTLLRPEEIAQAIAHFKDRVTIVGPLLENFSIDPDGKAKILMRAQAFQQALSEYVPALNPQTEPIATY